MSQKTPAAIMAECGPALDGVSTKDTSSHGKWSQHSLGFEPKTLKEKRAAQ